MRVSVSVQSTVVAMGFVMLLGCKGSQPEGEGSRPEDNVQTVTGAILPDETTPIGQKWRELLNRGINIGEANGPVQDMPGGAAQYQTFPGATIVYSSDFGATYMPPAIFNRWLATQNETDAGGSNLFTVLGLPTKDYVASPGHSETTFERGVIISIPGGPTRVVHSGIYLRYLSVASKIGLPVSEEFLTDGPGGRFQVFSNGKIIWRGGEIAAAAVLEPLVTRYSQEGSELGPLGWPLTDTMPVVAKDDPTLEIGQISRFENGVIFYSPASGAHPMMDPILNEYEQRFGGPAGWLGFPIGPPGTSGAGDPFCDFERGVLVKRGDVTHPFGDLKFHLTRVVANGEDCTTCGRQDLFYYVDVVSSRGIIANHDRFPNSGDYDPGQHEPNRDWDLGFANSSLTVEAEIDVWDNDTTSPDDYLGSPHASYSIDNLWGATSSQNHSERHGWAKFNIKSSHAFDTTDPRMTWWSFDNFKTSTLAYRQYALTFGDVDDDELAPFHPFNKMYFELAYQTIARPGNCFGMSLESINAQLGRSAWGEPIHDYFSDTQDGGELDKTVDGAHASLYDELNIKQGYQLGVDVVLWAADMFGSGLTHDPIENFNRSFNSEARHDFATISVYDDALFGGGHSLRPYRWEGANNHPCLHFTGSGNNCARLFVKDSNHPRVNITDPEDFIEVDKLNNKFFYRGKEGGERSGGRMFYIPYHTMSRLAVTPFNQAWGTIAQALVMLVGGEGNTRQISDSTGRTFFEPGLPDGLRKWEEVRPDNVRIPGVAPFMLTDEDPNPANIIQMWTDRAPGATHTYEIAPLPTTAAGRPIPVTLHSAKLSAYFELPATPGKADKVIAHDIGGANKAVSLAIPADGVAKPVLWTVAGVEKQRWTEFSNMNMVPGQNIRMRTENAGRKLRLTNSGALTTANIRYSPGPGAAVRNLGLVDIPAGDSVIEPDNVTCLSDSACGAGQYCAAGTCLATPTPASLAPAAWYDASPNYIQRTGNAVDAWLDRSGHNRHLQGSPHALWWEPTYSDTGWNGNQPAVTFDGSAQLRLDHWSDAPTGDDRAFTVLAVMRSVPAQGAAAQSAGVVSWWHPDGAGSVWCQLKAAGSRTLLDLSRMDPLAMGQIHTDGHDLGTVPHVVAWRYGGEVSKLTIDGVTTTSPAQPSLWPITTDNTFLMGTTSWLPTGQFSGDIAELVVVPSSISDADVAGFRAYARQKWGGLSSAPAPDQCRNALGQPLPATTVCDDGNAGTVADRCQSGSCVGQTPAAGSPAELSPLAWYSAADLDITTSGSRVLQWFDRSGNRRHLTQIFVPGQPTFNAAGWNGDPTLTFNGGNTFRREEWAGAPGGDDTSFTVLAVLRSALPQQNASIAGWWSPAGDGAWARLTSSATGTVADILRRDQSLATQDFVATGDLGTTTGHVIAWRFSPETAKLTVDGATTTVGPLPSLGPITPSTFLVGLRDIYGNEFFRGDLAELAVVPGSVSDAAVAAFRSYAKQTWRGLP